MWFWWEFKFNFLKNMDKNFYKQVFKNNEQLDQKIQEEFLKQELILRDYLAIERTILANEATFLAYIRTSLTIIVVGVTLFHLSKDNEILQYLGIFISLFGSYVFILGLVRSVKMKIKINKFLERKNKERNLK